MTVGSQFRDTEQNTDLTPRKGRRRRFPLRVRTIAVLAGGLLTVSGLALAGTAGAGAKTSPIKHIVLLYMENHSFDSVLGFWCDAHPTRCPQGGMPTSVKLSNGVTVTPTVTPDIVPNASHVVSAQRLAINGGKMNGWWRIPGCTPSEGYRCISGYKPKTIPNVTNLASKFAISDNTFSMADSPSWGGHLYSVMGSLDGFEGNNPRGDPGVKLGPGWGCNSNRITQWVSPKGTVKFVPSCVPDFSLSVPNGGAFEPTPVSYAPTIMDRLIAAHLSWRIYGQTTPNRAGGLEKGYVWDICPSFAECLDTKQAKNNVPTSTFINDAQTGNLASFSIVTPGGADSAFSEHNGFSMTAGDNWIGQVVSAIENGPDWNSTALFITWDDCGCFYDQVPPGKNPDGTQRGPRVPVIIVSPYAKPGYTDTTATTYSGVLAFVEKTFGLPALGVNDAQAYPFTNAFNFSQAPLKPVHMVHTPVPRGEHIKWWEANQDT